jgi:hypothetical protein
MLTIARLDQKIPDYSIWSVEMNAALQLPFVPLAVAMMVCVLVAGMYMSCRG